MYCSLKLILIVIFFYCRHSSSLEASDNKAKINTILTSCIGGGILVVLLVLLGVVLCLYLRMAKALKVPKPPVCLALKNNPSIFARNKITAATPLTAGCYPRPPLLPYTPVL